MSLWRRLTGRPEPVVVKNRWKLGDGSPFVLQQSPDLSRLLDAAAPEPPVAGTAGRAGGWGSPEDVRLTLVLAYLNHPDPRVRVEALHEGARRFGRLRPFQDDIVDLAADPDPAVHLPAVRTLWELQRDQCCELAVKVLRDEIRGHSNDLLGSTTEGLRLDRTAAVAALDRLVAHAPDDDARARLQALIDEHVVIVERTAPVADVSVDYVETIHRTAPTGEVFTYEVHRAAGRDEAIAYLATREITEELYYLEVETPVGTFGRDLNGIYSL